MPKRTVPRKATTRRNADGSTTQVRAHETTVAVNDTPVADQDAAARAREHSQQDPLQQNQPANAPDMSMVLREISTEITKRFGQGDAENTTWSVVERDGKPHLRIEIPDVTLPGQTPAQVSAPEPEPEQPAAPRTMQALPGREKGGSPTRKDDISWQGKKDHRDEPLTWSRIGYNDDTQHLTIETSEGHHIRFGDVTPDKYRGVVLACQYARNRETHAGALRNYLKGSHIASHDIPMDQPVVFSTSKAAHTVRYDEDSQTLSLQWKNTNADSPDQRYLFSDVPPDKFVALVASPSRGRYIGSHIRGGDHPSEKQAYDADKNGWVKQEKTSRRKGT